QPTSILLLHSLKSWWAASAAQLHHVFLSWSPGHGQSPPFITASHLLLLPRLCVHSSWRSTTPRTTPRVHFRHWWRSIPTSATSSATPASSRVTATTEPAI